MMLILLLIFLHIFIGNTIFFIVTRYKLLDMLFPPHSYDESDYILVVFFWPCIIIAAIIVFAFCVLYLPVNYLATYIVRHFFKRE